MLLLVWWWWWWCERWGEVGASRKDFWLALAGVCGRVKLSSGIYINEDAVPSMVLSAPLALLCCRPLHRQIPLSTELALANSCVEPVTLSMFSPLRFVKELLWPLMLSLYPLISSIDRIMFSLVAIRIIDRYATRCVVSWPDSAPSGKFYRISISYKMCTSWIHDGWNKMARLVPSRSCSMVWTTKGTRGWPSLCVPFTEHLPHRIQSVHWRHLNRATKIYTPHCPHFKFGPRKV